MPYKHDVTGSSPVVPTKAGPVVQLVRTPACHAGGRGFKSLPRRHLTIPGNVPVRYNSPQYGGSYADIAQSVEQGTENPRVIGSIPIGGTTTSADSGRETRM